MNWSSSPAQEYDMHVRTTHLVPEKYKKAFGSLKSKTEARIFDIIRGGKIHTQSEIIFSEDEKMVLERLSRDYKNMKNEQEWWLEYLRILSTTEDQDMLVIYWNLVLRLTIKAFQDTFYHVDLKTEQIAKNVENIVVRAAIKIPEEPLIQIPGTKERIRDRRRKKIVTERVIDETEARIDVSACERALNDGFYEHAREYRELVDATADIPGVNLPVFKEKEPLRSKFRVLPLGIFRALSAYDKKRLSRPDPQETRNMLMADHFRLSLQYAQKNTPGITKIFPNNGTTIIRWTHIGEYPQVKCSIISNVHICAELLYGLDRYFLEQGIAACYRYGTIGSDIDPDTTKNNFEIYIFSEELSIEKQNQILRHIESYQRWDVLPGEVASYRPHLKIFKGHIDRFLRDIKKATGTIKDTTTGSIVASGLSDCLRSICLQEKANRASDIAMSWNDYHLLRKSLKYFGLELNYDEKSWFQLHQGIH